MTTSISTPAGYRQVAEGRYREVVGLGYHELHEGMVIEHRPGRTLKPAWWKSSRSTDEGGGCLEMSPILTPMHIRDPRNPAADGPTVAVTPVAWAHFLHELTSR
ncbi:DUF397 domain-containing protein [Streptomyces xiangluensis]|uniref:DUF397 domain-containing protein n=1 Tax=Streptomyces xiangluensis TaxID=2665720 RepID=A0ABV8YH30_9ACTN